MAVGVRGHFDCDVGIVAQHLGQFVKGGLRFGSQRGLVEIIENIVHNHRLVDRGQNEVNTVFGVLLGCVGGEFLLCVQIAFCPGQHHVVDAALQREPERAVGFGHGFLVRAVVAHDADNGIWHGFFILVKHPSGNPYL